MTGFNMDDYVPVNERIEAFYAKHPEGSIQSEIVELTDARVTVKAYAYRSDEDARPGIGHSSLEIPGRTPYTKGSEIENAETSAWGRAIAALGFEVKRGLASAEEVRNKQLGPGGGSPSSPRGAPAPTGEFTTRGQVQEAIARAAHSRGLKIADGEASIEDLKRLLAAIEQPGESAPSPADSPEAGSSVPASGSTPDTDGSGMAVDPATTSALEDEAGLPPGTSSGPTPAPSMDDILAATGGEEIPPRPKTDEYRALPPLERAQARAYWDKRPQEEQESLAEALGAPAS
jgi:hypothetical protein